MAYRVQWGAGLSQRYVAFRHRNLSGHAKPVPESPASLHDALSGDSAVTCVTPVDFVQLHRFRAQFCPDLVVRTYAKISSGEPVALAYRFSWLWLWLWLWLWSLAGNLKIYTVRRGTHRRHMAAVCRRLRRAPTTRSAARPHTELALAASCSGTDPVWQIRSLPCGRGPFPRVRVPAS